MNTKRMHQLLLLIAVIALAAFAVPHSPVRAQGKSITFLTPPWGAPPDAKALQAFQDKTGIKVEVQSVPMDQLYSKVQVAAAANQAPADVIFLTEEAPSNIVAPGYMLDLTDYIKKDNVDLKDFQRMDFWTIDGKIYGITTYVQLVMLDYNAKKLKDAGFDAAPKTWKEFSDQAAAIKAKGVDKYPIAFGAIDWSWYLMALSMGDPMFDKDLNPVFANKDSKARAAMKTLLGYFKDELISPEMISGTTNQHTLFESGTGVFHQSWQGADKVMNNPKASKQAPDVKYMLMPEVGNTWSLDAAIGIAANSDNKDAAWEFIKWYIGPDNQQAIYTGVGLIPSRASVQDAVNKASPMQQFDLITEQGKHINYLPRYAKWWGPFTAKVTEQIKTSAQTGGTADDAVDALAKVWNDLKAEYSGK